MADLPIEILRDELRDDVVIHDGIAELLPERPGGDDGRVVERYGISFLSGREDVTVLLEELRTHPAWSAGAADMEATRIDGRPGSGPPPSVLLVGSPHTGQRRLSRMIALALAEIGIGDGAIRDEIDSRVLVLLAELVPDRDE